MINRQPGKALPFFLRLRRPNVFDLIREYNLFTDVQDQALLLVEFDQELIEKRRKENEHIDPEQSTAITLLVDHIHSIPVGFGISGAEEKIYRADTDFRPPLLYRLLGLCNSCKAGLTTCIFTWTLSSPRILS